MNNNEQQFSIEKSKFGTLTIISFLTKRSVECKCDCGSFIKCKLSDLKRGNKKSCGCLRRQNAKNVGIKNRKAPGENGLNNLFYSYKNRAKINGIKFELEMSLFKVLTSVPCFYCNKPPSQIKQGSSRTLHGKTYSSYKYNGIDRVYPSEGYVSGNVVSCCKTCNYAKHTMNIDEFNSWKNSLLNF